MLRAGHTESAVDLARMAELPPAGVLCEILDDRAIARDTIIYWPGAKFDLPIISIEQLIRTVAYARNWFIGTPRPSCRPSMVTVTIISYGVRYESQQPIVLVMGDLANTVAPLSDCTRRASPAICSNRFDAIAAISCTWPSNDWPRRSGVLVYLPQEGRGIGIVEKVKAYPLQDQVSIRSKPILRWATKRDTRDYGVGIQLLKDLGLPKVRLLTNNPKKTDAFIYGGFDLEVVDQIPIWGPIHEHNAAYLATKRDKLGHQLPDDA